MSRSLSRQDVSKMFPHWRTLKGHTSYVTSLAFSPDGTLLASTSRDNTLRLWRPSDGECIRTLEGHKSFVEAAAFSPDGTTLASASADKTLRLWDPHDFSCLRILEGHTHYVSCVAFAPDSRTLVSGSWDKTLRVWRPSDGSCCATLAGHTGEVKGVAFSPDGNTVASAAADGTVRLWDARDWAAIGTLQGHGEGVKAVAFSPDGSVLASASADNTVRLWNVRQQTCSSTLEGHDCWVAGVAFSPAGGVLASASWDDTVRLWDPREGTCITTLKGHKADVTCVAFSPDGGLLASGSFDNHIRLWGTLSKCWPGPPSSGNSSTSAANSTNPNPNSNPNSNSNSDSCGKSTVFMTSSLTTPTPSEPSAIQFSLQELNTATHNFDPNNKLGKGGQGTVYRAQRLRGTDAAVKVMLKSSIAASGMTAELNVLCHVRHPHIVALLGYYSGVDKSCLVYEFLPGGDLYDNLDKGSKRALTVVDRFRIAKEVASALVFLCQHEPRPIVHRDLKPQNIMLDEHGKAKIADWGLAKLIFQQTAANPSATVVGTCGYVAPEVVTMHQVSLASDMYSFGVVLMQLMTGLPHPGDVHGLLRPNKEQSPPPAASLMSSLTVASGPWPQDLAQRVLALGIACTSRDPWARPTADAALDELTQVYEAAVQRGPSLPKPVPDPIPQPNSMQYSLEELAKATNNFDPENKLGKGGQGAVFKGTLRGIDVAVKVMLNTSISAYGMVAELQVLSRVRHPHIVTLLGYCSDDNKSCLVYEYLTGRDLYENLLETAPGSARVLGVLDRLRIAKEVASALFFLRRHEPMPIVHRDLKPQNIVLDEHRRAKIADWGLAKQITQQTAVNQTVVGTFGYMAPEVTTRQQLSPASDMYSFGVILLQLMTGVPQATGIHNLLDTEASSSPNPAQALTPHLDPAVAPWPMDLAQKVLALGVACMATPTKDRPSAEKALGELTEVYTAALAWAAPPPPDPAPVPEPAPAPAPAPAPDPNNQEKKFEEAMDILEGFGFGDEEYADAVEVLENPVHLNTFLIMRGGARKVWLMRKMKGGANSTTRSSSATSYQTSQ